MSAVPRLAPRARPGRRPLTTAALAVVSCVGALLTVGSSAALAAAPAVATLVSPASGSTTPLVPTLSVTASDPDGGPLDVTFEGRRQGATVNPPAADPFTIVVLPDTQNYTYNNRQGTIAQQAQWVVNTRATLNTVVSAQLGDLVSEYDNLTQWGYVSTGLKVMDDAGMPNTVLPGNHDFDNVTEAFPQYEQFFPPSRYQGAAWTPATSRYGGYLGQNQFGPDPVDRRNMDNYVLFTAGGRDVVMLNLEFEPPSYVYAWADRVLAAYPDRLAIVTTHSYVSINGQLRTTSTRTNGTSPSTMWSSFISTHCQIQLVLSGHEHNGEASEARRTDTNTCGKPVHGILTDYQDRANGGDGWLRYYTFNPAANTMTATTYSPKLNQYETDADSAFTLPFDLGVAQPAPFAPIATKTVTSGSTASTTWPGLLADTVYEWRAVTGDGTATSTSPTWTLRTAPPGTAVDDTFTRTSSSGWGSTDTGQVWTVSSSTALTVSGGSGRITAPAGTGRWARLDAVSSLDTTVTADVAVSPVATGSGTYVSVLGRLVNGASYRGKLQFGTGGALTAFLTRYAGTTETILGTQRLTGVTLTAGQPVRVVLELTGTNPTTLRTKVWPLSAAEPATWTLTATDSTATHQQAGAVGLETYVSGSATSPATVSVDRLTVTGPGGAPANQPPTAVIGTPNVNDRTVGLSGSGSSDVDGTVTAYAWQFGDGTTATGSTASHTYAADGTYTVRLTVTDDDGATGTVTRSVTVSAPPANQPPTAAIGAPTVTGLTAGLSGSGSTDLDGTITDYAWLFGDGTTGTGVTTSHTYATDGTYTVRLTVTDDQGAIDTVTRSVTVTAVPPPNQPPTAAIGTPNITGLTVGLSGSGSTDADGTIAAYAWQFGDGTTGTGVTTSHTYAADGTYTVTLTVTDDDGDTGTTTRSVTVAAPPPNPFVVADDFARTVTSGWGSADTGGAWTTTGTAARYSVSGGVGTQSSLTAGTTLDASLRSTMTAAATTMSLSLRWDRTGAGGTIYTSVVGRAVSTASDYRLKVVVGANNVPLLDLVRRVNGTETLLARTTLTGTTLTANTWYSVRLQLVPSAGTTTLRARLWVRGTAEPATWQVTASDGTAALQAAGWVGLATYMSSSATQPIATSFDDLRLSSP